MRASILAATAAAVLTLTACGSEAPSDDDDAVTPTAAETPSEESPSTTPAGEDDVETDEPDTEEEDSGVLGLGASAEIGDYTVTVLDVQLDANEVIQETNEFNDPPEGQYALVSLEVTYNGEAEADPWLDLSVELAGSDARIYDSGTCAAATPNSAFDLPTLTSGGEGTFDVCFDVPAEALENPQIHVEESLSFSDTRVVWGMEAAPAGSDSSAADDEPEPDVSEGAETADGLPWGETAELGGYTVSVSEVQLDANEAVQGANSFNDSPEGQYVLVSLDLTYNGDEEGDAWLDLSVKLSGSDSRIYDTSSCMAVSPNPITDLPTLTAGGSGEFDVCFDVPPKALHNPEVIVEESFSFEDNRAVWRTSE